ncbi:rod shape-determining protein RodA [Gracilibacillus oryzae]|uniref:Rod shape-determining protein RodA n=1 Tax=Gracilibacillus oryzae TaxID=1672701 RepID=A0A7C8KWK3_9BACI|nr:FtsW/RodA/SpoVE family cell cycle protein [Gracilibacillus oryzae]KAB8126209.1 rod shape-determining protein RodA [Gracilibacillus oryzae]
MTEKKIYVRYDLIYILLIFFAISILSIYYAQQMDQYGGENFVLKQAVWIIAGIIAIVLIQFLDISILYSLSFIFYLFGLALLILLLISPESIVPYINGAYSWFRFQGITFQPSELVKITTILFLSAVISKHKEKYDIANMKSDFLLLFKIILIGMLPVMLILLQPDFGTAMVVIVITVFMLFLSNINWKIILLIASMSIVLFSLFILSAIKFPVFMEEVFKIDTYQIDRIQTWVGLAENQSQETYQIDRALLAIGSGQLNGYHAESSLYIPESHTDFIFSVIAHKFGFFGSSVVIFLYFLLIYKLIQIGMKVHQINPFGAYICFGYMTLIFIHAFQNIGMNIGVMPITGIPLLLISYGGSSTLAALAGYGLIYKVACVQSEAGKYMFNEEKQ